MKKRKARRSARSREVPTPRGRQARWAESKAPRRREDAARKVQLQKLQAGKEAVRLLREGGRHKLTAEQEEAVEEMFALRLQALWRGRLPVHSFPIKLAKKRGFALRVDAPDRTTPARIKCDRICRVGL